jgi:acetylornithine deacetylase
MPAHSSHSSYSDPVDLTIRLMSIESTSDHEGEVIAWLDGYLRDRGWRTQRIPVTAGRDDLFATMVDEPVVTLSTHLDTVPPYIPPTRDADRIYGRGSCDAKGVAAAMICAAERLRDAGLPIALLFVVGEEVSHDGAHAANAAFVAKTVPTSNRIMINGEPTESTLALGTKGALRVVVHTAGKAAHSAYPHLGHSATRDLVHLLADLDDLHLPSDSLLGETTVNIGALAGGVADNVMAPSAEGRLMFRLVTPSREIMRIVEEWAQGRATLEWGSTVEPVKLGVVEGFGTSVAAFATDIPALPNWGTPFLYGPGSILVAHTDGEFIAIEELRAAIDGYERLVRASLAGIGG